MSEVGRSGVKSVSYTHLDVYKRQLQQVAQGDARQVLHHEVGHPVRLALIEDVDDVRVPEAGRAACLLLEAAREVLVVGEVGVHDLSLIHI